MRRARASGLFPRSPHGRRAAILQPRNLPLAQLGVHGHLADLGRQAPDLGVARVALPAAERAFQGLVGLVAPLGQLVHRNVHLPRKRLKRLSGDEPADDVRLATRRSPLRRPFGGSGPVAARRRGRSRRVNVLLFLIRHGGSSRLPSI